MRFFLIALFSTLQLSADSCNSSIYSFLLGKPIVQNNTDYQELCYSTHAIGYDTNNKMPLWVEYKLNQNILQKILDNKIKRSLIKFDFDPSIDRSLQLSPYKYKDLKYIDRGHFAPYFIVGSTKEEKFKINYMTNISPQNQGLNRGCWRSHELKVKKRVENGESLIITIGMDNNKIETQAGVNIPTNFFMLIYSITNKKTNVIYLPNKKREKDSCLDDSYINKTEKDIEEIVKINFYPNK